MATLTHDGPERWRVDVVCKDSKRRPIRFKADEHQAQIIRDHVTELERAVLTNTPPAPATAGWARQIGNRLHAKLARRFLVEPRERAQGQTLRPFLDGYLAQRKDVKPGTMMVMRQAQRHLQRFFGDGKAIITITQADADAFRAHLLGNGKAKATVAKWCGYGRYYLEVAKRRRLIQDNPFGHIKGTVRGNLARRVQVPAADVLKVIDAAVDPQWKLLIALARWGGLRVPSEALTLRWADVDLDRGRFIVRSSKTEHHEGGGVRVVPVFPELRPHFETVFADDAAEGAVYVITRYRDPATNLRTQLGRYITAAGLTPWPKPWQNLRATRATELADQFPSHVCAKWLGHTEAVADEFYRQVTDEHFARAVGECSAPAERAGDESREIEEAEAEECTAKHAGAPACKIGQWERLDSNQRRR